MISTRELAAVCLAMEQETTLYAAPDDPKKAGFITKITRTRSMGFDLWVFINAEGKATTVVCPSSFSEKERIEALTFACNIIPGVSVKIGTFIQRDEAMNACRKALLSETYGRYPEATVAGFYFAIDRFIAFDNTTEDCFIEEYATEREAIAYLFFDCETADSLAENQPHL